MKSVNPLFVSALYYGINKGIGEVMGSGGMVLSRVTSKAMLEFLREKGILHENMSDDEVKELFVKVLGLSEDLEIQEDEMEVSFVVVKPTLVDFLKKVTEENIKPYICPFIHILAKVYENGKDYKLMLEDIFPEGDIVKLKFKKVR